MRKLAATLACACAVVALIRSPALAAPDKGTACVIDSHRGTFGGTQGVVVNGVCWPAGSEPAAPPTKTIFCGRPSSQANALWNRHCGPPRACLLVNKKTGKRVTTDAFATLTMSNGHWTHPVVWCPANAQPAVNLTALRARAQRLLPTVPIGSAWTNTALVNAETILWAATTPTRTLPAITLLGRHIALRINFDHASWTYGDHTSDTHRTPGKAYDPIADPCHTAQCPHYTGHTYLHTGTMTITLTITWHAQYSLDTNTWTDITGTITGPTSRHTLTVKQARGILVPNPGN